MHWIIGHMDADGHCSSSIVYHRLVNIDAKAQPEEVEFVHINYGMELPEHKFNYEEDYFYMVDFSLQPLAKMVEFAEKCGDKLVWIDHHDTAIENSEPLLGHVRGTRESGKAACVLTWEYFFPEKMPQIVELVGTYDIWDNDNQDRWNNFILPIQTFLRSFDTRAVKPKGGILNEGVNWWCMMFLEDVVPESVFEKGRMLMDYSQREDFRAMKGKSYRGKFDGHSAIFINRPGNSQMFESFIDPQDVDLMIWYEHSRGKYWSIHIYSVHTDRLHCGKLAERIGHSGPIPSGGGHAGAAGFQTTWEHFWNQVEVEDWKK
jgi:hypothetical protein